MAVVDGLVDVASRRWMTTVFLFLLERDRGIAKHIKPACRHCRQRNIHVISCSGLAASPPHLIGHYLHNELRLVA